MDRQGNPWRSTGVGSRSWAWNRRTPSHSSHPKSAARIHVPEAAAYGLALIGNQDVPAAVPALLQAAKDTDKDVRRTAVSGLGDIESTPELAIPAIVVVLEKDESYAAARALAQFGPKAAPAIRPLMKALGYKDSLARSSAAEALGKIGPTARALRRPCGRS